MSVSRRKGKKKATEEKEETPVAVVEEKKIEEVSLEDIFTDEPQPEPEEEKQPASKPEKPEVKKGDPYAGVVIDVPLLLRFIARLKYGHFGQYGNGANFANHMIQDCFKVDGKKLSIQEASALVRPFTSVPAS